MILSVEKAKYLLKKELKDTNTKLEKVNSNDEKIAQEQKKIKTWIFRKSYPHPYRVYQCTQDLKKEPEIISKINELKIPQDTAFATIDIISYLHDIGRLKEVDFNTGLFLDNELKKEQNFTHAKAGYEMLKAFGVNDLNILLPIKYHDNINFKKALETDKEFKSLNKKDQEIILFYGNMLQDADKMSNILEVSTKGLEGRLEMFDPKYKQEAKISPKVKEAILNGKNPNRDDEQTRADALVRFATWTTTLNFEASKNVGKKYMKGIFNFIKNEANNNQDFTTDIKEIYEYLKKPTNNIQPYNNKKSRD